jgi:hypothetical protein
MALLVPAAAGGATVSVEALSDAVLLQARYVAAPGERNRLAVSASMVTLFTPGTVPGTSLGTAWTFSDSGAVITPGIGCTAIDQHTVRCVPSPFPEAPTLFRDLQARIDAGDLDDEVSLSFHSG